MAFELELGGAVGEGVLLHGLLAVLEGVAAHLPQRVDAEFDEALWERCVGGGVWKVIFGGCCYCVLFNHQIHQYAISYWWII